MPTPVAVEQRQDSEVRQDAKETGKRRLRGKPWTSLEDRLLARLAAATEGDWNRVSAEMRKETETERTPKQCRERYKQYVRNDLSKDPFSPEEDALIVHAQSELGNQWSKIAKLLPGRADNQIKNRWNTVLSKRCIPGSSDDASTIWPCGSTLPCPRKASSEIDDEKTYTCTGTTESTLSACNSPTHDFQPLEEDCDMHASLDAQDQQGHGMHEGNTAPSAVSRSPSLSPSPHPSEPLATLPSSALLHRLGAVRNLCWMKEGHLDTPSSPRAHLLHSSILTKLFLKSGPPFEGLVRRQQDATLEDLAACAARPAAFAPRSVASSANAKRQEIARLYHLHSTWVRQQDEPTSSLPKAKQGKDESPGRPTACADIGNAGATAALEGQKTPASHHMYSQAEYERLSSQAELVINTFLLSEETQPLRLDDDTLMPSDPAGRERVQSAACNFDLQDIDLSQMSFAEYSPVPAKAQPAEAACDARAAVPVAAVANEESQDDDWDLERLREQQEMIERECRLKYQLELDRERDRQLKLEQLELMRLEQDRLRLKQEQDKLKRRLARPHSAQPATHHKDIEIDSASCLSPFALGSSPPGPRQPFALSSPSSSRRELVAGGGFGFSPTAVSTASTADPDLNHPSHLTPSPRQCTASRAHESDGARPSTLAAARTAASSLWAHKASSVRSPRTPEKKRIRLTQKNSADMSDIGFLNVPAED